MSILKFANDNYVNAATPGFDLTGALTILTVCRPNSSVGFRAAITGHNATTPRWSFELTSSSLWQLEIDGGAAPGSVTAWSTTTDTLFAAVTKAAGSATPRFHGKNLTTGAATVHENSATTNVLSPSSMSGGFIKIGNYGTTNSDDWLGDIGVIAVFDIALSDANIDTILAAAATSAITAFTPKMLVECVALTPTDIGSAPSTFSAATGATLTGTNPDNWTLDGGGSTTPPVVTQSFQAIPFMTR
jgi:hypothetical protein